MPSRRRLLLLLFYALVALALRDLLRHILQDLLLLRPQLAARDLLQIHIVFKHGHRAPFRLYETDPNNAELWEEGLGFLTKLGRLQTYNLGRHLRERYASFLSSDPSEISVRSSIADRSLFSAYSFLCGFYPPDEEWRFDDELPFWQPIPVHYVPEPQEKYLQSNPNCPMYEASKLTNRHSEEVKNFTKQYKWYYEFWHNNSQKPVATYDSAGDLFKTLSVERDVNLSVPEWALRYWDDLVRQADVGYYFHFMTRLQQRLRAGPILGLILDHMKAKITENTQEKVFVYSGHGSNVAAIQCALQSYDMKHSPHGAALVQELWREGSGRYSTRILFFNSSHPETRVEPPFAFHLQGCNSPFCPLEAYEMEVLRGLVPRDWKRECAEGPLPPGDTTPPQIANIVPVTE